MMNHSPVTPEQTMLLADMEPEERERFIRSMTPADALRYDTDFEQWMHEGQVPPSGDGWRSWLMLAGRGYGKTRAGAEWITRLATQRLRPVRIALVGATPDDVRNVMIEGESGLLAVGRAHGKVPHWEPSLRMLHWPGGSVAFVYSGADPDGLRGPQHHYAWCDELAKWAKPEAAWDNLQMTLRLGERPRALVTTTPRPIGILKTIEDSPLSVTTRGRMEDNVHLPENFVRAMIATYGGTRLGRQELDGEIIRDAQGALWTRELIEGARVKALPEMRRVVIGVDPPASAGGDACGIVAAGLGLDGIGYVLGDHSVRGLSPEGWARAVAGAYAFYEADRIVAEKNMGGDMVESTLRAIDANLPVRPVSATRGKSVRAEPVAALFEKGKAKFARAFSELEDELAGMIMGGGYEGPGRSPDRADAMVWAMTELMLRKERSYRISLL